MGSEKMNLGGKKENEPEKKKDHRRNALRFALAAIGALNTNPSPAAPREAGSPAQETTVAELLEALTNYHRPQESVLPDERPWFTAKLKEKTLTADDMLKMEDMILSEKADLSLQIRFLQRAFRSDGPYRKAFEDPTLHPNRFSGIIRIVDHISTSMTKAYSQETIPGFQYLNSFAPQTLANSSQRLQYKGAFCNGGLYRDSIDHRIRFGTDVHCAEAAEPDILDALTFSDSADAATMLVTPKMYEKFRITDPESLDLPILDPTLTADQIIGQPVISYSYGPDGNLKVHLGVAMPWTETARTLAYGRGVDEREPLIKDQLFMLKPPEEGVILERDNQGRAKRHGASGSSGSLVVMPTRKGLYMIGTYVSTRVLESTCDPLCYTMGNFNTPAAHERVAKADRQRYGISAR